MDELLRRAWDALDIFKQTYPENWADDDERLLNDLMRTDMKLSGVKLKWIGLTDEEIDEAIKSCRTLDTRKYFRAIEAKLKEKNT
jgi:hypothetical protein